MHHGGVETTVVSDAALASLAQGGDLEALAVLLERHRPSLYAAAVGLLGNRADALDVVQDTFVVALLRLADLRDANAVGAWLHAVLRNLCRMRIRQHRELPSGSVELPDAVPGPEEALEQHIMGEWVWHALDNLSADERLTVMLRYFTRCTSYDTIARVTSVPVGTVRSRLNRARRRLADLLMATASGTPMSHADLQAAQRTQWEEFYRLVHHQPVPQTYQELFTPDVDVRDPAGHWRGIEPGQRKSATRSPSGCAPPSSTCWPAASSPSWRSTSPTRRPGLTIARPRRPSCTGSARAVRVSYGSTTRASGQPTRIASRAKPPSRARPEETKAGKGQRLVPDAADPRSTSRQDGSRISG